MTAHADGWRTFMADHASVSVKGLWYSLVVDWSSSHSARRIQKFKLDQ